MNGSLVLDVAIGLVLMYLVISLFCTVIQEWIAQIWSWRGKNLEAAIIHLLNNGRLGATDQPRAPSKEASAVLDHPLFKMLAPGSKAGITAAGDKPSYVTATNFALALIDALKPTRDGDGKLTFAGVRAEVDRLETDNPGLHKSLRPILDAAEGDLSKAIDGIERWFDAAMDRASGWYKRNVKRWLLGIAAVLAIAANADTIQVALRLSEDSGSRAAVVAYAATIAPAGAPADERLRQLQSDLADRLTARDLKGGFGGLPVGWDPCIAGDRLDLAACYRVRDGVLSNPLAAAVAKFFGLALTVISASLGAPFWFGLLQTLNAARGTGPKPLSSTSGS